MARVIKAIEVDSATEGAPAALRLRELADELNSAVLDARQQAARILAEARQEARAIHLQAEEAGYADGFDRGRQEGLASGERRAHELVRAELRDRQKEAITECSEAVAARLPRRGSGLQDAREMRANDRADDGLSKDDPYVANQLSEGD